MLSNKYARTMLDMHAPNLQKSAVVRDDNVLATLERAFGVLPKPGGGFVAKEFKPKYRECPKCGEKKARRVESGADTDYNTMELRCDGCGKYTELY